VQLTENRGQTSSQDIFTKAPGALDAVSAGSIVNLVKVITHAGIPPILYYTRFPAAVSSRLILQTGKGSYFVPRAYRR
jgi:hypothetical protein